MERTHIFFIPVIRNGSQLKIGKATGLTKRAKDARNLCSKVMGIVTAKLIAPFDCMGKIEVEYIPGQGFAVDVTYYGVDLGPVGRKRFRRNIEELNSGVLGRLPPGGGEPRKLDQRLKITVIVG